MQEHYKRILKGLENFRFKRNILTVFQDVISIIALRTSILTDPLNQAERKKELEVIAKRYDESDLRPLLMLFYDLLKDLHHDRTDALGWLYMQLVPKSSNTQGKVYTPYHVAKLMCEMSFDKSEFEKKDVIEIYDPCCGGGVFSIAYTDLLNDHKINYTEKVIFHLEDLDEIAAKMAYIQLSYLGASAIIHNKNTLTQQTFDTFRTGGYILAHVIPEQMVKMEMEKWKLLFDLIKGEKK
jgi:type I restriction-modification system DNA methylase subunit